MRFRRLSVVSVMLLPALCVGHVLTPAFQAGEDYSRHQQAELQQRLNAEAPATVPGDQGSEVPGSQLSVEQLASQGRAAMNQPGSIGQFVEHSLSQQPKTPTSIDDDYMTHSHAMMAQGTATLENSQAFCHTGTCADTSYQPLPMSSVNAAISALSAVSDAGSQVQTSRFQSVRTFTGTMYRCRDMFLGYNNCCSDTGWGQQLGLAGCNSLENTLWNLKGKKQCVYVGRYCAHKVKHTNVCTEHKKTYCCFNSVLGRVVQQQGRWQLGWGWGSAKHPQCQGLSQQDLQRIDFSRLNYQDYYEALGQRMRKPVTRTVQQQARQSVARQQQNLEGRP